jgi:hypothetical protein
MKIIDSLTLEGSPAEIPNCSRDDLPQFFVDMGYKKGVEIGVYIADFTTTLAAAGLNVYGVDSWLWYPGGGHSSQRGQDQRYQIALEKAALYPNCTLIRKTSSEALKDFEDGSLDFVYIDGDHSFPYIAHDVYEWSKKIRVGGVMSGHDYFNTRASATVVLCHVGVIVDAYTRLFKINNWYILTGVDKTVSWFWIKK